MRFLYWLPILLIAMACALFAVFNRHLIIVDLWPFAAVELPLYPVVLGALLIGFLFGRMAAWPGILGLKRDRFRLAKQAERLQAELDRQREAAPPSRSLVA